MSPQHILTIDLGTSGPKAAVVSTDGGLVGAARASVPTNFGPGGEAVQDAELVWRATLEAARGALAAAQDAPAAARPSSVAGVVASAQYSSVVPVTADGTPIAPMITWMDQRSSPRRLKRLPGYPRIGDSPLGLITYLRVHGLAPLESGMSLNHMRWFRYAHPDLYERTASILEPVDYLTARLTGRMTANQCTSFMQMLADNRTIPSSGWHPDLVKASMIDADKLPEWVPVGSVVGTVLPAVADKLGLPSSTPVLSGLNDSQAGGVAAGAFSGTHAGLAVGTTAVIVTHLAKKKVNPLRSLFTMPSPLGEAHLLSAENGVAGVAVDYFLDHVVYPDDRFATPETVDDRYRAFNEVAAASPPGAGGVLFLPWLRGSLAPRADGRMRGGFLNVGLETSRSDLARAVLEGVALNLRWLQTRVETFINRRLSHYVFYGGGARSDLWASVMADVLDKPVHQLADAGYANSIGTAIFGFDRLGIAAASEVSAHLRMEGVFEPDPTNRARYDDLAETFVDAFKRTRPLSRRLARRP
jgi:xylulokinase